MALIDFDGFPNLNDGDHQVDMGYRAFEVGKDEEADNEAETLTINYPPAKEKLRSKNVSDGLSADIGITTAHLDCKWCKVKNSVRSLQGL